MLLADDVCSIHHKALQVGIAGIKNCNACYEDTLVAAPAAAAKGDGTAAAGAAAGMCANGCTAGAVAGWGGGLGLAAGSATNCSSCPSPSCAISCIPMEQRAVTCYQAEHELALGSSCGPVSQVRRHMHSVCA